MTETLNHRDDYHFDAETDIERLAKQHKVFQDAMGTPVWAPVDLRSGEQLSVLDSGTSNGEWLVDLNESCGNAQNITFVGIDIDATRFPKKPPTNMSFLTHDVLETWPPSLHEKFDLTHQRLCLAGFGENQRKAIKNLTETVRPGGWIQLVEGQQLLGDTDLASLHDFNTVVKTLLVKLCGSTYDVGKHLKDWLEADGFVDLEHRTVDVLIGKSNADPALGQYGVDDMVTVAKGMVEYIGKLDPSCLRPEFDTLPGRLEKDLKDNGGRLPLHIVWGRKSTPASKLLQ